MRLPILVSILLFTVSALAQDDTRRIVPIATEPHRWALVIGNDDYPRVALKNAVNDARSMQSALQSAGFTVSLALNTNLRTLDDSVHQFLVSVQPGDVALIYYSGHGIQIDGENYLIPIDFAAQSPTEARYQAYSAQKLLDLLQDRAARLNILVLDACRDNPFKSARSAGGGLAAMDAGKGTYIAFATAPGKTASDNSASSNGLFTGFLVEELARPGLSLDEVFNNVRAKVIDRSNSTQIPWSATSVVGTFTFRDPDLEEKRARAEAAALEEKLKQLQAEVAQARQRQSAEDELRKQQEEAVVKSRLDFERKEEERLAKEREQRQSQTHTADASAERTKAEQDRMADLRHQFEAQQSKLQSLQRDSMTWDEARQQVASVNSELLKTTAKVEAVRGKAFDDLDARYRSLREELKKAAEKDMFETTAQYQARLAAQQDRSAEVERKYAAERADINKRYDAEIETQGKPLHDRQVALQEQMYLVPASSVRIDAYDADKGQLSLTAGNVLFAFPLSPAAAKQLYATKDSLQVRENMKEDTAELINPLTGQTTRGSPSGKTNPKDGLTYVWIPAGSFYMGCSPGKGPCSPDEKPSHNVWITKGFWLGQTPVTQRAWRKVIGANPSHDKGDSLPVEQVTWEEAKQYCEAIGGRLPTEAEWEYAARAGTGGARYGNLDLISWHLGNSDSKIHEVGTKEPNAWKLYDMLGNVWQWTQDWYGPYSQGPTSDPRGPQDGDERVLRGGSWDTDPRYLRVSVRNRLVPGLGNGWFGLRCVVE